VAGISGVEGTATERAGTAAHGARGVARLSAARACASPAASLVNAWETYRRERGSGALVVNPSLPT